MHRQISEENPIHIGTLSYLKLDLYKVVLIKFKTAVIGQHYSICVEIKIYFVFRKIEHKAVSSIALVDQYFAMLYIKLQSQIEYNHMQI